MRIERHPTLDILVREDGCIYLPQSGTHKPKWTFGCNKNSSGYMHIVVRGKSYKVHRLVVETFIGDIPDDCEVDHINRNRIDNRIENLRIVTRSLNMRNTPRHDKVTARGGTHSYEDMAKHWRECTAKYRAENREKIREREAIKLMTFKRVRFSDGSRHYVPINEAKNLLAVPIQERYYGK